jgi:deoxyribodipyrimidine photo-lyase
MSEQQAVPAELKQLADDARVTVRRGGAPDPDGKCVVYWMQRAERGRDNRRMNRMSDSSRR